ncbi:MAG: hypothetical protein HY397_00695 [Candidatus Doudnabacteria bacterium]|nr:hypothetical protein [Candidatus Doudnabacteria bacterium]
MELIKHRISEHKLALLVGIGVAVVLGFLMLVVPARADNSPPGCTASGVGLSLTVFRADGITPVFGTVAVGETIKYEATLSHLGGSNCNFDGGTLTITLPSGSIVDVTPLGGIPLVTLGFPFVSSQVSYVVSAADIGGDDDIDASSSYTGGTSHRAPHTTVSAGATDTQLVSGTIIIEKQTLPNGDPQVFDFDSSYGGGDIDLSDGQFTTTPNLAPGTYSVTENVPAGWDLADITCTDPDGGSTDLGATATIDLDGGETVTCLFENTKRAHIIIEKNAIPDSSQAFTFNNNFGNGNPATFQLVDDSTPGLPNYNAEVLPGTYAVTEDPVAGWQSPESTSCDAGETVGSIDVAPGETVTCTFTNEKLATIILVKNTFGGDDSFDFDATGTGLPADIDLTTIGGTASQTFNDLDPDNTYTIAENVPGGWDLTSAVCTGTNTPGSITPDAGETITCTFTNEKDAKIVVIKQTDPDGVQTSFEFDTSYSANFFLSDGQSNDSGDLDPGTYSVSELTPAGWDLISVVCSDGSDPSSIGLAAGETVTCTFTNQADAFIIVEKQTDPDGDSQLFDFTTDYGPAFQLSDGQTNNSGDLSPGTYSVSETVPAGWDLESAICSDGSNPAAISLQAGETVTCTFINEKDAKIIVVKQTTPDGAAQVFDFSASWDAGVDPDFSLSDGQSNDSGDLDPGIYSVSENVPAGWSLTSATCSDLSPTGAIVLQAGETVTCTFENLRLQQESRVETHVHDPSHNPITGGSVPVGTAVHDQATVIGDGIIVPTGPVAFDLFADPTCQQGPPIIPTEILPLGLFGPGATESTPIPLPPGSYGYLVSYSGDQVYLPSQGICEPFEIEKLPSEVVTQVHDANHLDITNQVVPTGTQVHDKATVIGAGPIPTGTVDFNLFSTIDCTGLFATESGVPLDFLGQAESTPFTPLAGPLSYLVTYSGDQNYLPSEGRCEPLTVKGPTRTQGFWQTHFDLAEDTLATMDAGERLICGNRDIDNIAELMGGFWSSLPYRTTSIRRSQVDQARMQLAQQLLAAMLNKEAFGTDDAGAIATGKAAFCTSNRSSILAAAGALGAYNESGDLVPSPIPTGSADPQIAQSTANKVSWDSLPGLVD